MKPTKPLPKTQAEQIAEAQGLDPNAHLTRHQLRRKRSLKRMYRAQKDQTARNERRNAAILRQADAVEAEIQRKLATGEPLFDVEMTDHERQQWRKRKRR